MRNLAMTEWTTKEMTKEALNETTTSALRDELLPLGAAFLRMAERRAGRALSDEAALAADALMRAFAEASHKGSVCVRRQDLLATLAETMPEPFGRKRVAVSTTPVKTSAAPTVPGDANAASSRSSNRTPTTPAGTADRMILAA